MLNTQTNRESAETNRPARVMSLALFVAIGAVAAQLWVSSPAQAALAGPANPITGTDMNIYNERTAGVFMSDNVVLGLNTNYSFISRVGGYANTTSPTQQPVRFDTGTAHSYGVSVQVKFIF